MIRWKYLLPRMGLLLIAILLINVFSKPITRWMLVQSAQSVTGARVDIGDLKASLWDGRLQMSNLQMADPRDPMKNLLQADEVNFDLSALKILHKQWLVENAALKRIQFGTPRTESGSLPGVGPRQTIQESVLVQIARNQAKTLGKQWLNQIQSQIPLLVQDNLETVQLARQLQIRWPEEFDRQRTRALDLQKQAQAIREMLQQRSENPLRDLERYQTAMQSAQQVMSDIAEAQHSLHQLNRQFKKDKSDLRAAQKRDRQKITDVTSNISLDGASLTELLLGETQTRQVEEAINWITWFRDAIPNPETDFQPIRARGYDVQFRRNPGFVFQNLELSGEGLIGGQNYKFAGTAKNLSTAPQLLDEPTTLELRGQGKSHIQVSAVVDRRTSQKIDKVRINCPKLPLPSQILGDAESLMLEIAPSKMSLVIEAEIVENRLRGKISVQQTGVEMQVLRAANISGDAALMKTLNGQLASVDTFSVSVDLGGSLDSPEMELQSDLGTHIAELLADAFQSTVTDLADRKAVELRNILDQQLANLDQIYTVNTTDILQLLSSEITEIADLQELLEGRNLSLPTFR